MSKFVFLKPERAGKCFSARVALMWPVGRVHVRVQPQVEKNLEALSTGLADVRPFSGVDADVALYVTLLVKTSCTDGTAVRLGSGVRLEMRLEIGVPRESPTALVATIRPYSFCAVGLHVLLDTVNLHPLTTRLALIRFFHRVNLGVTFKVAMMAECLTADRTMMHLLRIVPRGVIIQVAVTLHVCFEVLKKFELFPTRWTNIIE